MKEYLWETHLHTAETSRCGITPATEMVFACKERGYSGLVVTDHFLNGYNRAPERGPWQKRIDIMLRGYKAAKQAGDLLGIVVLCGCEFADNGADYLTYGVGEDFWRDQPDLADIGVDEYVKRVHAAGGLVSQAHPYRNAWYMPQKVIPRWDIVDAIEVFNGSHSAEQRQWDRDALALAQKHNLLETAGSDVHNSAHAGTAGISFPTRIVTDEDFLAALRARTGTIVRNRT